MAAFASITTTTEKDLAPHFRAEFAKYLKHGVRGFGFWMWKPELILREIERIPDGEVLLYLDAGCHLNPDGHARLSQYVEWVSNSHSGLLAFQYRPLASAPTKYPVELAEVLLDRQYTKSEALEALEICPQDPLLDDPAIAGGIIFVKKCNQSLETLRLWREMLDEHPEAFTDELDQSMQDPSFRETRHDQSIFSIRAKQRGIETVSAYETWVPKTSEARPNWRSLGHYPIHARRDLKNHSSATNFLKDLRPLLARCVLRAFPVTRWRPF